MAILNCIDEDSAQALAIAMRRHCTNVRYVEVCHYTADGIVCYYVAAQMKPER